VGQVAKRAEADAALPAVVTKKQALYQLVESNPNLVKILPASFNLERFKRMLLVAANKEEKLLECSPASFIQAAVTCAILALEPNDPRGLAYLVPFRDKDAGWVVNLIVGYKGMVELATRSGKVNVVHAHPVYKTDVFSFELGTQGEQIIHVPDLDGDEKDADLTHAYAWAKVNGEVVAEVVTRKRIEKARASSRGADSSFSPWKKWYPEMSSKTAIRVLAKRLPQTPELAAVIQAEDTDTPIDIGMIRTDLEPHLVEEWEAIDVTGAEVTAPDPGEGTQGGNDGSLSPGTELFDPNDPGRPF
jgi:recombination protein RecT